MSIFRRRTLACPLLAALVVFAGCACATARPKANHDASATTSGPARAPAEGGQEMRSSTCARFAREPVDMGVERAMGLALSSLYTCVVSDDRLLCAERSGTGDSFSPRIDDVARAGGGGGRRVCVQRKQGTFDCLDGGTERYDFGYFHARSPAPQPSRALVIDRDVLTVVAADGSLITGKIGRGTDANQEEVWFVSPGEAAASGASVTRPSRIRLAERFDARSSAIANFADKAAFAPSSSRSSSTHRSPPSAGIALCSQMAASDASPSGPPHSVNPRSWQSWSARERSRRTTATAVVRFTRTAA